MNPRGMLSVEDTALIPVYLHFEWRMMFMDASWACLSLVYTILSNMKIIYSETV